MDYLGAFLKEAKKYSEFEKSLEIVKDNCFGKIYLIGGFIYRNIVSSLYGKEKPIVDFDFIIEKPKKNLIIPNGWKMSKSRLGSPKFIGPSFEIDFVPIENIYSFNYYKLKPTIENYLNTTPLNIQSIIYDVKENNLFEKGSFDSIKRRIIIPNKNRHLVEYYALKKETTIEEKIKEMAKSLGFDYLLE